MLIIRKEWQKPQIYIGRHPITDDTRTIHIDQILSIDVNGDWDVTTNCRQLKYAVRNSVEIEKVLENVLKKQNWFL